MKKHILLILCFLLTSMIMLPQDQIMVVSGTVIDDHNEPLIGVSVIVKNNPGLGVITDIDGKFKIKVEPYSHLVFSYIGYTPQETLIKPENTVVNIKLAASKESVLEEITVTGTGLQKKVTLTGAITTVDVKDINTPSSSLANALAGNVAGVMAMQSSGEPGAVSEFWIRGISTFGGGSQALVLVDGFERSLDEINVEDVESFTVLKDASTTAIYGARGANGVILITSKRGQEGKIKVDTKVEYTIRGRAITPKLTDGYTYATMLNEALTTRNKPARYSEEDLLTIKGGLDSDLFPSVDWMDMLLRDTSPSYRASVNVKGGANIAKYYLSISYLDEAGTYKVDKNLKDYNTNSNYKRWNYRMNVDLKLTPTTTVAVGVAGSLAKHNHSPYKDNIWESLLGYNPILSPAVYSNGYVPVYWSDNKKDGDPVTTSNINPWTLATESGFSETWNNSVQTNITLNQKLDFITKGLSFTGRVGFDIYNKNTLSRYRRPELWTTEKARDSQGEIVYKRVSPEILMSQLSWSDSERREFLQADLVYNRTFGDHNVGGILKYTQDSKINTANVGTDIIKGVNRNQQSLAGNISYGYKSRYFFNFNFGYSGSENFAKGHQFGFFPAYSAAWNLAEESFLKDKTTWLEMFKIRYSYGEVGNDAIGQKDKDAYERFPYLADFNDTSKPYKYLTHGSTYDDVTYNWGDLNTPFKYNGLLYTKVANAGVTWEIAKKHDLGVDIYLFGDKVGITVDYFNERRDGMYMERKFLPEIVGIQVSNPSSNLGSVKTTGFDGTFSIAHRINKVNFTLRGNFTHSKSVIKEYDELYSRYPYTRQQGYRYQQSRGLIALGLFKDYDDIRNSPKQNFSNAQEVMPGDIKYKDVNGDGIIDSNDILPIGATRTPNLVYGLGLSAEWNGFDFNVHFVGTGKSNFFINGASVYPFQWELWGNPHRDISNANRWQLGVNEDPNAELPRLYYGNNANNYRPSTYWLRDGKYLRLKTLEFGYTIPKVIVNKFNLEKVRIRFTGQNLLTFSKFKMWDPEMASANGRKYPLPKTYTFSLLVNI